MVVLDRDGVINEDSDDYIRSAEAWVPIPGSIEAIGVLTRAGFRIAVVTNQSGLARGFFGLGELNAMHMKMRELAAAHGGRVDMVLFCPHGPWEHCNCRKPQPGLLRQIEARTGVRLRGLPLVGDSGSDVVAARCLGMKPLLVKTGKGRRTLASEATGLAGIAVFEDLLAVSVELINRWGDS